MEELIYWIWLSELKNLGPVTALKYIYYFGTVKRLYEAERKEIAHVPGSRPSEVSQLSDKSLKRAKSVLENCRSTNVELLTIEDSLYPARLANIYDPPIVLYYKGTMPCIDEQLVIGIVGTRKASAYGIKTTERISCEIASGGGIVATGLAEGIDSTAAKSALEAGGFVIGVLGTGVDITYPSWNRSLQNSVGEKGLLLSEYPPGTKASRGSFPARNRIISGISLGVAVIEAPLKSGSLITASRAAEQDRDIFVVPGNIDLHGFVGSNELIRDGACLLSSGWDILNQYEWRFPDKISGIPGKPAGIQPHNDKRNGPSGEISSKKVVDNKRSMEYIDLKEDLKLFSEDEKKVITALSDKMLHIDEIITSSGLQADRMLAALTQLELNGYVTAAEGKRFALNAMIKR